MSKKCIMILFFVVILLVGCGLTKDQEENLTSDTYVEEGDVKNVTFTQDVTQLEDGLSYVEYDGDYGFSDFIDQGGAVSDSKVVQFLIGNVSASVGNETFPEDLSFADAMFGCSTVSVESEDGDRLFGRNFDWDRCNALIVKSTPLDGYSSISTVNSDFIRQGARGVSTSLSDELMTIAALYAPLDGMNEEGFCISVNMIEDENSIEQDTQKPDLTTTTAVRLLLNSAATVDQAIQLLEQYDLHSSMGMMVHFAMSDQSGRSVVVEYINNEMIVTDTPVVTNFYITQGEKYGIGTQQSHQRYEILMDRIENSKLSMEEVRDALDSVSKDNFDDSSTTEWSIVFNQDTAEAVYYHREDYSKGYHFSLTE